MLINRMRSSAVPLTCSLLREQSKTPLPPSDLRVIQQAPQTLASAAAPEAEAGERGDRASPGREAGRASPLTGFFAVTVGWSMAVSPVLCDIPPPRRCAVSLFPLSARTGVPSIKPAAAGAATPGVLPRLRNLIVISRHRTPRMQLE